MNTIEGRQIDAADLPSVLVVVVTYNSAKYIASCLNSIHDCNYGGDLKISVVDNGSTDETASIVESGYPEVLFRINPENVGFAAACNQAIECESSDYVLLLNPDAELLDGTLAYMVDYMERSKEVGIVGPRLVDQEGNLQKDCSATGILPGFSQALFEYTRLHRIFPDHPVVADYFMTPRERMGNQRVAMVQGACFLFRRTLYERLGPMDGGYFLYFEETDYCKRAHDNGWEVHYLGEVPARHVGAHSMPDGYQATWYFVRSLYRYHMKNTGVIKTCILWFTLTIYHCLKVTRMARARKSNPSDEVLARDLVTARDRLKCHFFFLMQTPHLG